MLPLKFRELAFHRHPPKARVFARCARSLASKQRLARSPTMLTSAPRRVFSGIQPTGRLHLGNYLGAVRNWVTLQDQFTAALPAIDGATAATPAPGSPAPAARTHHTAPHASVAGVAHAPLLFSIVDLHAMTMPYTPAALRSGVHLMTASLLACGIDPGRAILFRQSDVREHSELAWIFSCVTPLGWLNRMTQYKEKSGKGARDRAVLGLLSYPVLQAADILLYRADGVPVGEDQHQHLELARDIGAAFNRAYCGIGAGVSAAAGADGGTAGGVSAGAAAGAAGPAAASGPALPAVYNPSGFHFPLPATLSLPATGRIMSLRDGAKKMSKSEPDDASRINLTDGADAIRDKIRRAKTDSLPGFSYDPAVSPEKANLLDIFAVATARSPQELSEHYASAPASAFKGELADAVVALVAPISQEIGRLMADPAHLEAVLARGGDAARAIAADTMTHVRALTGLGGAGPSPAR
jgi:tryptophanyl-tRNA synthetase